MKGDWTPSQIMQRDVDAAVRQGSAWLLVRAVQEEFLRQYAFGEGLDLLGRVLARLD